MTFIWAILSVFRDTANDIDYFVQEQQDVKHS